MAVNERDINIKINHEIKKYETLKKAFLKLYESENKASKSRRENFERLSRIQENDNSILKDIYSLFINDMKSLEDKRNIHLNKIMDLILPVTDYYPEKLKKTQKNLEELTKLRKNKAQLEKSRNEIKNDNVEEVQKINVELVKSRNEEMRRGVGLENEMCKFESERGDDNKFLFLHFIHSELKYHAAALEKMSELFYKINEKEPQAELEEFKNRFKIEFDLNDLGIDIEKLKEKNEKNKKLEEENIDDVYESTNIKKSMKKSQIKESQLDDEIENLTQKDEE